VGDKSAPIVAMGPQSTSRPQPMAAGTGEMCTPASVAAGNDYSQNVGGGSARGEVPAVPISVSRENVPHAIQCSGGDSGDATQRSRAKKEKNLAVVGGSVFSTEDIIQLIRSGRVTSLSLTFNL
jgi:hypothetical protein